VQRRAVAVGSDLALPISSQRSDPNKTLEKDKEDITKRSRIPKQEVVNVVIPFTILDSQKAGGSFYEKRPRTSMSMMYKTP